MYWFKNFRIRVWLVWFLHGWIYRLIVLMWSRLDKVQTVVMGLCWVVIEVELTLWVDLCDKSRFPKMSTEVLNLAHIIGLSLKEAVKSLELFCGSTTLKDIFYSRKYKTFFLWVVTSSNLIINLLIKSLKFICFT